MGEEYKGWDTEQQKESVKLTKNAKGKYQWEVKVLEDTLNPDTIKRLDEINTDLNKRFGEDNEEKTNQE